MTQTRIFVIHSEKDKNILNRVVRTYNGETFGNTTLRFHFLDSKEGSGLGTDFGKRIMKEIRDAKYAIAIISSQSITSTWVNQEIGYAKGIRRTIMPMKAKSLAKRGIGFLHSNIDAQLFEPKQRKFPRLEKFFTKKSKGNKTAKILGASPVIKPRKENTKIGTRRVRPDVI
jgi:hypothetical protein